MKTDRDKIEALRKETGQNYSICEKALKKSKGDYKKAKYILTQSNKQDSYTENIYEYLIGERSFRFGIKHKEKDIFNVPIILPIFILLLLPIRSYLIAFGLILLIVLNCSLYIEINEENPKEYLNVLRVVKESDNITSETSSAQNETKKVYEEKIDLSKDKDGYSHLIIR